MLSIQTGATKLTGSRILLSLGVVFCLSIPARSQPPSSESDQTPKAKAPAVAAKAAARAGTSAPRQVTVFAILAIPDSEELDPRLASIQAQLHKLMPKHGFKLRDVRSKRVETGQSVVCDLGDGYKAQTTLVKSLDENGKVQLRCQLTHDGAKEFSTLVRSPLNQLFFYEHSLKQGSRVLIGVGAR